MNNISKESTDGLAHSVLGASSSHRWMHCPASVEMAKKAPKSKGSAFAMEGTAAHELAEMCLLEKKKADHFKGHKIKGFEVNDEMIEAVNLYYDTIRKENKGVTIEVEKRFNLGWLYPGMFGTNDACTFKKGLLRVYDYKHGAGIAVDADDNSQLVYYAIGASYDYKKKKWRDDIKEIEMVIIQPRAYHFKGPIRRWRITFQELKEWAKKIVISAKMTNWAEPPMFAGDHCGFCPAAGMCPQLHDNAQVAAKTDFQDKIADPKLLTKEQIVDVVNAAKMIRGFLKSCEDLAFNEIMEGKKMPGLKMIRGRGSRRWEDESEVIKFAETKTSEELFDVKLKSPAKLEKLIDKKELEPYIYKVEGSLKVVPESDKGREIILNAADDFKES